MYYRFKRARRLKEKGVVVDRQIRDSSYRRRRESIEKKKGKVAELRKEKESLEKSLTNVNSLLYRKKVKEGGKQAKARVSSEERGLLYEKARALKNKIKKVDQKMNQIGLEIKKLKKSVPKY